jgi:hypothetical protein
MVEGGVVVDAQVAPNPHDRGAGHARIVSVGGARLGRSRRRVHDSDDADADGMLAATSAGAVRRA